MMKQARRHLSAWSLAGAAALLIAGQGMASPHDAGSPSWRFLANRGDVFIAECEMATAAVSGTLAIALWDAQGTGHTFEARSWSGVSEHAFHASAGVMDAAVSIHVRREGDSVPVSRKVRAVLSVPPELIGHEVMGACGSSEGKALAANLVLNDEDAGSLIHEGRFVAVPYHAFRGVSANASSGDALALAGTFDASLSRESFVMFGPSVGIACGRGPMQEPSCADPGVESRLAVYGDHQPGGWTFSLLAAGSTSREFVLWMFHL